MALKILTGEERIKVVVPVAERKKFSWDDWYAENKDRLSKKRADRYANDPEYRAKALERSRQQREKKKEPVTDGFTIAFADMAQTVGVTVWVLREWRRKDYFPEPSHREGRLWFKPEQTPLLQKLKTFFDEHEGRIVTEASKEALQNIVSVVYSNWQ